MYDQFLKDQDSTSGGAFQARARYSRALDAIEYLSEDCAYTSERVDGWLTVFWHPSEPRLVGLRVKGIRHIFLRASKGAKRNTEELFKSLVAILELVVRAWGEENADGDAVPSLLERTGLYWQAKLLAEQVMLEQPEVDQIRRLAA